MGVIAKQSIRGTIYLYFGFGIGFVTSSLLFPRFLSSAQIGLFSLLISISVVFGQFGTLGFNVIAYRFFPYFQDRENKHNGFPRLLVLFSLLGCVLSVAALFLLKDTLIAFNLHNDLFVAHYNWLIPLTIASLLFINFEAFTNINLNVTTSIFLRELFQRFCILIAIMLLFFNLLSFEGFAWLYIIAYSLPSLMLIMLLRQQGNLSLRAKPGFISPTLRNDMIKTGFWGVLLSLSNTTNVNIDKFLLGGFVNLAANGVYATVSYFGILVSMPARVMRKITSAMLSHSWKENDWVMISRIYKKTTTVQYLAGSYLFLIVWLNADNIFRVLPDEYKGGQWVLFWSCILNLFEMIFGSAGQLLYISPRGNVQTYMTIMLIGLIVGLNFWLIPIFGLTGCAIAMVIAFSIFHATRIIYVAKEYGIHPFERSLIHITLFSVLSWLAVTFIPYIGNFILDGIMRVGLLTAIYMPLSYYFKVSSDVNAFIDKHLKRLGLQQFIKE